MLNIVIHTLFTEKRVHIFNWFGVIISFSLLASLYLTVMSNANEVARTMNFKENTYLLTQDINEEYFSDQNLEKIYNDIPKNNIARYMYLDLTSTKSGQNVEVYAVDDTIFDLGIPSIDYKYEQLTVENVEILHGSKWNPESTETVAIVDEYTALSTFGYTNVVGEKIELFDIEFEIIAVVSNTTEREADLLRCESRNDVCNKTSYASMVFVPYYYNYLSILNVFFNNIEYIVIHNEVEPKNLFEEIYGNQYLIFVKSKSHSVMEVTEGFYGFVQFSKVIIFTTLTLAILNVINTNYHNMRLGRRDNVIYRMLGATRKDQVKMLFYKGLILGGSVSIITMIMNLVITMMLIILFNQNLIYLDIISYFKISIAILLVIVSITILLSIIPGLKSIYSTDRKTFREVGDTSV